MNDLKNSEKMIVRGLGSDIVVGVGSKNVLTSKHFPSVKGDACILSFDEDEGAVVILAVAAGCEVVSSSGEKSVLEKGSKAFLDEGTSFGFGGTVASIARPNSKKSKSERTGVAVGPLNVPGVALGTLQLGVNYPSQRMSRDAAIALVRAAYAGGVRLFDTSDAYCRNGSEMGYVEELLRDALANCGDAVIGTKGGMTRHASSEESNSTWGRPVNNPQRIEELIRESHRRLKAPIRLWQIHHVDEPATVKCMEAAQKLQKEGLIEVGGGADLFVLFVFGSVKFFTKESRCGKKNG